MMRKLFCVMLLLFVILTGCSSQDAFEPQPIDTTVDSCDECHMGIQDVKASSEVILKDGTPKKFDDIGCMVLFIKDHEDEVANVFVHDYVTSEWIDMYNSTLIQGSKIKSPMNYDFVAFSSTEEAKAFQTENGGELYTSGDVLKADVKALKDAGHGSDAGAGHENEHNM